MLRHLVVRLNCRLLRQLNTLRVFSTTSLPECVNVYVSADRARFYKSMGLFCLAQGSVWLIFGQYLLLKCDQPVTWSAMKGDVSELTRRLAALVESWTPDAVANAIFQSRRTPQVEDVKLVEANDARVGDAKKETEKGNISDLEIMVGRLGETFAIKTATESTIGAGQKDRDRAKLLVPYLCLIMGAFTLFVGGFIPRRVIRRISLVQWNSTQGGPNDRSNPTTRVNTYGWFGFFPRSGALFTTRLNNIRAAAEYREGKRFMNLIIAKRPFVFYLERLEAEFILPEYFEHLNSSAISRN